MDVADYANDGQPGFSLAAATELDVFADRVLAGELRPCTRLADYRDRQRALNVLRREDPPSQQRNPQHAEIFGRDRIAVARRRIGIVGEFPVLPMEAAGSEEHTSELKSHSFISC